MSADDHRSPGTVRLVFPADPLAVRAALERLFAALPADLLDADSRGSAEIVIAEVLNNIVEHAYADLVGEIEMTIRPAPDGLLCLICDRGRPLPAGCLSATPPAPPGPDDMPEGGFGWYLIHALGRDVAYSRDGQANRLSFRVPGKAAAVV